MSKNNLAGNEFKQYLHGWVNTEDLNMLLDFQHMKKKKLFPFDTLVYSTLQKLNFADCDERLLILLCNFILRLLSFFPMLDEYNLSELFIGSIVNF